MATPSFITRSIELQTLTWLRDSNSLFDYEDPYLVKQSFSLTSTSKVFRISDLCIVREEQSDPVDNAQYLGIVSMGYSGQGAGFVSVEENAEIWQVVRAMSNCVIDEGDVLRVGRTRVEVVQISTCGYDEPRISMVDRKTFVHRRKDEEVLACRICLSDQETKNDPLLTPCLCSGTMGFIHFNCLREWLRSKLETSDSGKSTVYSWTPPHCELCKTELPLYVNLNGLICSLMDIKQPKSPFIVLKVDNSDTEMSSVHVVSMNDGDSARIVSDRQGRSPKSDIRIDCRSLSRKHAEVRFTNGEFTVVDRKSKYGTLVLRKGKVSVEAGQKTAIQVGRTVLVMKLKHKVQWKALINCCRSAKVRPEPVYRLDDNVKDEMDRSDQTLIRRLNDRIVGVSRENLQI